uniref:Protein F20G2.6, isoform a n=2 Tax=Haemonchus contortus TaxID=6289 RepID=W6NGK4_HAECO
MVIVSPCELTPNLHSIYRMTSQECPMFDFGGSPVFIFVPFIAFSVIFLLIILLKSCVVMGRSDLQRGWATQARRVRRPMNSHSTASVEIQTSQQPVPFIPPPGYYSEVMATDSSAMYPMYVPPYSMSNTPQLSMRDPRRFQGLPGLQAPPPYPPPPSYSQIQNFPELPTVSNARLDNRTPSRNGKKSEITPVE